MNSPQHARPVGRVLACLLLASCVTKNPPPGEVLDATEWRQSKAALYQQLAGQLLVAGDAERSQQLLRQAVQFNPQDVRSIEMLTRLAHSNGNLSEARRFAQQWRTLEPQSIAAACASAAVAEAEGDNARAEELYREACALDVENPQPWFDLHSFFLDQGREEEAGGLRERLAEDFPKESAVWVDHGSFLASRGRWQEASVSYEEALTRRPERAEVLTSLGASTLITDRPERVLAWSNSLPPRARLDDPALALILAGARIQEGDPVGALRELDLLQTNLASEPVVCLLRGELLLGLRRLEEAYGEFERAAVGLASPARAHAGLGRIHLLRGELHAGIRWLEVALDSDPDNAVNHALLAGALARSGDMERAARHYQRARRPAAARMVRELQEQFPEIAGAPRGENQP